MAQRPRLQPSTGDGPETGAPPRRVEDPIAIIMRHHRGHLELCDWLESIADSLPDKVDIAICRRAMRTLSKRVREHHVFEEHILFPLLRARSRAGGHFHRCLDRLENEHRADEGYAEEILDLLNAISRGRYHGSPDVAGYMLRGLFETLRRHIAFENDHVLPQARRLLSSADLAKLRAALRGRQ